MIFTIDKKMVDHFLKQLHSEHVVIQMRALAQRLLEIPLKWKSVSRLNLFWEFEHSLKLDYQSWKLKAV